MGVLCWMVLIVKEGTNTSRGSAPFATPYKGVPGFVIAPDAIEPTLLLLPSTIAATTLTAGDDCAVAVFVKSNVTTHAVPDAVPTDAAVNTSCPDVCVHAPLVPSRSDVEEIVKLVASAVCDPVSPVIVTVDPVARSKLAVNETVNVLVAPDTGVLCWIDFRLKVGTSTVSGSAPFATPYSAVPGFVIAADAMVAVPDASTFIVGDVVTLAGFVIWNPNVYVVDAARLPPVFTVSVKVPEFHAPFP